MHNKKIFLVVGMHRSGTSLITNCIQAFGLQLAESLVPAGPDNADGFFEDSTIVEYNIELEEILGRSHMSPGSILPLSEGWLLDPDVNAIALKIKKYLENAVDERRPFLLKDPRISTFFSLYTKILEELKISPIVIFVNRDPASVIRSKSERDNLAPYIVEQQWVAASITTIEKILNGNIPSCFVNFERFLTNPNIELKRVGKFLANFTKIKSKPIFPKILLDRRRASLEDREKGELRDFSTSLAEFIAQIEMVDDTNSGTLIDQFDYYLSAHKQVIDGAKPWIEVLRVNGEEVNYIEQNLRQLARISKDLKSANAALFGARGREDILLEKQTQLVDEANVLLDEKRMLLDEKRMLLKNMDALRIDHKQLENEHEVIQRQYSELRLLNRTKIFRLANAVQYFKTRKIVMPAKFIAQWSRSVVAQAKRKVILVRRSLMSNGWKKTLKLIVASVNGYLAGLVFPGDYGESRLQTKDRVVREQREALIESKFPELTAEKISILHDSFSPGYYRHVAQLGPELDATACLDHFLNEGLQSGLAPFPLFNRSYYSNKAGIQADDQAFIHWLTKGVDLRIVPTVLFDEAYFIKRHSLVLSENEWAFIRFVTVSVYRNATPNQYFDSNWYLQTHSLDEVDMPPLYHYMTKGYRKSWRPSSTFPSFSRKYCAELNLSPMELLMNKVDFERYRQRTSGNPTILSLVEKASQIEPKIGTEMGQRLNILPFTNPNFPALKEIRASLSCDSYDDVVLIPHCRYGGSGMVAGELCRSLLRIRRPASVLLIRTDNDDFMRPDWFPREIEILNLLDFACDLPDIQRGKLLLDMLIGLRPKHIYNVHSRLGWEIFKKFGDRLNSRSKLYGYTFCYDVNLMGQKVGYPVKYVPGAIENLDHLLVDNTFLKSDLIKANDWNESISSKISVLWTPYQREVERDELPHTYGGISTNKNKRKKVYWAGRFDRQKRFDLVIKIARKRPDIDFHIWGAAMLGDEGAYHDLPENMFLHGLFQNYSDIPLKDCDVWLYTSQWDGLPTILIELGLRGIPMVATRVWGTADLIDETTSWPVDKIDNVSEYCLGIDWVLENPEGARIKAEVLREKVLDRHNSKAFDKSLLRLTASKP